MRRLILSLLLFAFSSPFFAQDLPLMPWPQKLKATALKFDLKGPLCVLYRGEEGARLKSGIQRLKQRLARKSGLTLDGPGDCNGYLVVQVRKEIPLAAIMDESYEIEVLEDSILVRANTDIGALRAFSTIYQLHAIDGLDHTLSGVVVADKPRFAWRGLLMDVCRHFMPKETIIRQLDGMELVKMNVLHLHLTEDQGFRIESLKYPELHQKGSNGDFLSQADIREIIREADDRGIRVIPEFDMPGHTTAWFVSHPELASAPGPYEVETGYGVFDPTMDPSKESTYSLLDGFLGEMADLFPDAYIHIGGDENNGKQWAANDAIQVFMQQNGLKNNHELQAYFNKRLSKILAKHGKRMIGWDEVLADDLPQNIVIQSWRGKEGLIQAAKTKRQAILSNGYYIDLCHTAAEHYENDPLTSAMGLSKEEEKYVLGGEATMWAELVDEYNVDTRIWPRTAAIAERLWSPASVNNTADMYKRLDQVSLQLDAAGIRHIAAQQDLLRIVARSTEVRTLQRRVDVIAPVRDYQRHRLREHSTHSPLTNLADVAVPDPAYVRFIDALIEEHFNKRTKITSEGLLGELRLLRIQLKDVKRDDVLPEIPFIQELLDMATESVHVINGDSKWNEIELLRMNELLQLAREPFSECELVLLAPLDRLFQAAIRKSE